MSTGKHGLTFVLALSFLLAMTSCAPSDSEQPKTREEVAEAFLTEYFTADKDGRYQDFCSETETEEEEQLQSAAENYHAGLAALASSQCIDSIVTNRTLLRYDTFYEGVTVTVDSVSLSDFDSEGVCDYTVSVTADGQETEYTGQITVTEASGQYLVDHFWSPI